MTKHQVALSDVFYQHIRAIQREQKKLTGKTVEYDVLADRIFNKALKYDKIESIVNGEI